jgi:hypothetical protein
MTYALLKRPERTAAMPKQASVAGRRSPRIGGPTADRRHQPPATLGLGAPIQAKLKVGAVHDPLEQEADAIAERVVSGLQGATLNTPPMSEREIVQRKCDACDSEEEQALVQRTAAAEHDTRTVAIEPNIYARIDSQRHLGRPLPVAARSLFETNIGHDLSGVRIHDDHEAASLSRHLRARAFTVGGDIFFARNEYQPQSLAGKRLLAHELVHTVQQGAADGCLMRSPLIQRTEDDRGLMNEMTGQAIERQRSPGEMLEYEGPEIILSALSNGGPLPGSNLPGLPTPRPCEPGRPITPIPAMSGAPAGAQPIVSAVITPWSTVPQGGSNISSGLALGADDFGISQAFGKLTLNATPAAGGFAMSGSFNAQFKYNVRVDKGPYGQLNVTGPQASFIDLNNYIEVMSDLWPFSASCGGGRPAREKYWSKSLTIDHEIFHIVEYISAAQSATAQVNAWLATQSMAASSADFNRLAVAAAARWSHSVDAAMAAPASEDRAYAAGRQDYVDLAYAVFDKF